MPALTYGSVPFPEQIEFFRAKINLPTATWRDIQRNAHDRAFVVAGAQAADLLTDLREAVDAAIAGGETLEGFRARFDELIARHGWDYRGPRNWRTRVIYQTNMATSYAAGRLQQLRAAAEQGMLWMYRHADGVRYPRPLHVAWDGRTLEASDPWWRIHYPPNDWLCHCYVIAVRRNRVRAMGGRIESAPDDGLGPGGLPAGVGEGWDYMPGARASEPISNLIRDKLITWDASIGSSAFAEMSNVLVPALTSEFRLWADAVERPRGEVRVVGALAPDVVAGLRQRGVVPSSAHLAVRDEDVLHSHRDSKADTLPWNWYRELPTHVAAPAAVLLDKTGTEPGLLYVFDVGGSAGKVVVRLDYRVAQREPGGRKTTISMNVLRTGKLIGRTALLDRTAYEVLQGDV